MFTPGQKLKCVDATGCELTQGAIYTCASHRMHKDDGKVWVQLEEWMHKNPNHGWYAGRFKPDAHGDFKHFMDRVMKPVNLDQPVTA